MHVRAHACTYTHTAHACTYPRWRCYARSTLDAAAMYYVSGSAFCTRDGPLSAALHKCLTTPSLPPPAYHPPGPPPAYRLAYRPPHPPPHAPPADETKGKELKLEGVMIQPPPRPSSPPPAPLPASPPLPRLHLLVPPPSRELSTHELSPGPYSELSPEPSPGPSRLPLSLTRDLERGLRLTINSLAQSLSTTLQPWARVDVQTLGQLIGQLAGVTCLVLGCLIGCLLGRRCCPKHGAHGHRHLSGSILMGILMGRAAPGQRKPSRLSQSTTHAGTQEFSRLTDNGPGAECLEASV